SVRICAAGRYAVGVKKGWPASGIVLLLLPMIGGQVLAPRSKPRRPVLREAVRSRHLNTGPAALLPQAPICIHASPPTRHPRVLARAIMKIRVQAIHREASARGRLHPE